jgi:hypothetical protein
VQTCGLWTNLWVRGVTDDVVDADESEEGASSEEERDC